MQTVKAQIAICVALAVGLSLAYGQQQPRVFKLTFKGTAYQRDGSGNLVGVPITDQNLIAARTGGNTQNLALAYILDGDEKGDTIEIINTSNNEKYGLWFGLWFGDDRTMQLGRTALTNATQTEIRRVDQVFTLEFSEYSSQNGHGVGTSFVAKRFVRDTSGNVHTTIDGQIQWLVNPWGTNQWAKICHGSFVATQPLF